MRKNQQNTQEDIEKKQAELQKIASSVPESARNICRTILDHKGIFLTRALSTWFGFGVDGNICLIVS